MIRSLSLVAALLWAAPAIADPDGKTLFTVAAVPPCGICHTLADAGSAGQIGPNLDDLKPSVEQVRAAISQGVGIMPAFTDSLSAAQIQTLAEYVNGAAGG
ncbi:MAG: cytochrome c [Pseudomonadota bacterium]